MTEEVKAFTLRWYQQEAKDALYNYFRDNATGHPCVTLPTGSGKTPLLSSLCEDAIGWNSRVCVVAHVKELIEQAYNTLSDMLGGSEKVGLYSAGLNKRDTTQPIICAGIQSVFKRASEFSSAKDNIFEQEELKPFDLLIIDEAHLVPDEDSSRYRKYIADLLEINPYIRIIGLTATPYRLKTGLIYKDFSNQANHANLIFDANIYEASVKLLIIQGYLCPIKAYGGSVQADLSKVSVRAGDYVASEMSKAFAEVLTPALSDSLARCDKFMRKSILVFAASVEAGKEITALIRKTGATAELITGDTPTEERDRHLIEFKEQRIRFLVNVNVLTTGFDAPNVDCIILLRATKSPGLYSQMVGRGLRLHPDKDYCLILDYGGNTVEHGPIDNIKAPHTKGQGTGEAPMKSCEQCGMYMFAATKLCPECGFEFTQESIDLLLQASKAGVLSGEITTEEIEIKSTSFYVHYKRGCEDDLNVPRTMRVEYEVGYTERYREWVCFEHEGGARQRAYRWWKDRCPLVQCPEDIEDAVALCSAGVLPETTKITLRTVAGERWPSIVGHDYGKPLNADEVEKVLSELHEKEEALNIEMMKEAAGVGAVPDWFVTGGDDCPF